MNKTEIEWCDYTWNPIKGICPVGCWYCYARKIYRRFRIIKNPGIPGLSTNELEAFGDKWTRGRGHWIKDGAGPKKPSRIFVCSTFELFHPMTKRWKDDIFTVIKSHPEHTFIILTKLPQNIDRPMPDNVWLGTSITRKSEMAPRIRNLYRARARTRFISIEPMLEDLSGFNFQGWLEGRTDWLIVGRLTGHGKEHDPKLEWLEEIVRYSRALDIPLFMKNNLADIWPGKLIQEFPKEQRHDRT